MTDEVIARAARNIMQVVARLHEDGMNEGEIIEFVSEVAYDYFQDMLNWQEITGYPREKE